VHPIPLILVATAGFRIGMSVNYGLAYRLGRPYVMRNVSAEKFDEFMRLWGRWGWVLYTIFGLIPFLPVELLALVCGVLKMRLDIFLVLSFVPRLIVFAILAYFGESFGSWIGLI
jgi:membrane protein YqaA with SNARE-associated domain